MSNVDACTLSVLLGNYFPCLIFYQKNNIENLDIFNHVRKINNQWTLDLAAMSRSKSFARLFHEDFLAVWDENEAIKKNGNADVIRFFVDSENGKFLCEFSKLKNADLVNIGKGDISEMFLEELNYDDSKPVWEDWDFSKLVYHKPSNIYKAFAYYAHKKYTLSGFGLVKLCNENDESTKASTTDRLLLEGSKSLDEMVRQQIPETTDFRITRMAAFFELEQEVLESVPTGGSIYTPTEAEVFIKQLKGRITNFLYTKKFEAEGGVEDWEETLDPAERANVRNHMNKIGQYIDNEEDYSKYRTVKQTGTYREKVKLLNELIRKPSIHEPYTRSERDVIEGLSRKLSPSVSLDKQLKDGETGESFSLIDTISEKNNIPVEDRLSWAVYFENVFKHQFNEAGMKKFLECIPEHFDRYPFEEDDSGNVKMSKYSEKMFFPLYCSAAGITEDRVMWKPFLVKIRLVVDSINKSRKDLRSVL